MRLFALAVVLALAAGSVFAQSGDPNPLVNAPLSSKIWDDPSLANLSSKAHKALGYATVTLGTAAILMGYLDTHGSGDLTTAHQILGESAAIGAVSTVGLGLVAHWDKLSWSGDLWTWHNLHALVAGTGAASMVAAGLTGGSSLHSKLGILGTALMAVAIVLEG